MKEKSSVEKTSATMRLHARKRDKIIYDLVKEWYEPGRRDRSKMWVWRNKVCPVMPVSERSFFRALERHRKFLNRQRIEKKLKK